MRPHARITVELIVVVYYSGNEALSGSRPLRVPLATNWLGMDAPVIHWNERQSDAC